MLTEDRDEIIIRKQTDKAIAMSNISITNAVNIDKLEANWRFRAVRLDQAALHSKPIKNGFLIIDFKDFR